MLGIILFYSDLELFAKNKKGLLLITPEHLFVNVCKMLAENFNSVVVGACQSFPDKQPSFMEITHLCQNLGIGF